MGIYNLGGGGGAPELQAKEATPLITNAQQIILPDEGYDGLSKVTVNPMPTGALKTPTVNSIGYVSSGVQTAGYLDTSATSGLQLSTQAAKTITPATYSQTAVASGKYTTGAVTVAGDSDLVASNIKSGVNIFGVNGSYTGSPTIFAKATRGAGQTQGITATFHWNSSMTSYGSPYKLIAFDIRYNSTQPISDNYSVTEMQWYAYDMPALTVASAPIQYGVYTTSFTYFQTHGTNVAGSNCTIIYYSDYINVILPNEYNWSSKDSYNLCAWFDVNPQKI